MISCYLVWLEISNKDVKEKYASEEKNTRYLIGAITREKVASEHANIRKDDLKIYRRLMNPVMDGENEIEYSPVGYVDLDDTFDKEKMILYTTGEQVKYGYNERLEFIDNVYNMVLTLQEMNLY